MNRILSALLVVALLGATVSARAAGALAIDRNHGAGYGFSYDYAQMADAERRALNECGPNCRVVLRFQTGCGAYAADQARGSRIYGWGTSPSRDGAQSRALDECGRAGGRQCIVRVWGCNSR